MQPHLSAMLSVIRKYLFIITGKMRKNSRYYKVKNTFKYIILYSLLLTKNQYKYLSLLINMLSGNFFIILFKEFQKKNS